MLPNILLIVADDAGWNDVGYHNEEIITPNIDSLARSGVMLENFYVYPTCSPTRASLMTGKYASRFGIYQPIAMKSKQVLPSEVTTLPGILRSRGYQTAIFGKWHLGLRPENGPLQYGFDYSYGFLHGQIDQLTHRYKNGDSSWHRMDKFVDEQGHATDLIAKEAMEFITSKRDAAKPFFIYVPFSVPHYPIQESSYWIGKYQNSEMTNSRKQYAASISHMDHTIGLLCESLKQQGLSDNTVVIFISDNGGQANWTPTFEYQMKHGPYSQLGDNTPLRGYKGEVYEGGIRVPAILHWPGKLGSYEYHDLFKITDLLPTLAAVAGVLLPDELLLDGDDLLPALYQKENMETRELYLRTNQSLMYRKGPWKLIHHASTLDSGNNELFRIDRDPKEIENLVSNKPEIFRSLWDALKEQVAIEDSTLMLLNSREPM
jgi:arylsulfatase A-like enzyme